MRSLFEALSFIALLAYLLTVPVVLAAIQGWSGHDLARLLQWPLMLLATAAVAWRLGSFWTWGAKGEQPPRPYAKAQEEGEQAAASRRWPIIRRAAGIAMLAFALLAVWRAPVPAMALRELALVCGCLALACMVRQLPLQQAHLLRAALTAAGGYALLTTGLALVITLAGEEVLRVELFTGYGNLRFYSHVLTAALPLVLAAHLTLPGRLWRAFSAISLALLGMMVFATGGRGTLLALVVAAAVVAAIVGRRGWSAIRPLVLGLAAGLLGFLLLFVWPAPTDPAAASALGDYSSARLASDQGRLPLWQHAIDMTLASPWWGSGPMHFAHGARLAGAHPHNLPLQIAAEWGLPMLALVCLFIGAVLHRAWQRLRTAEGASGLGVALCIGVLAVLLDSLVSGNFVMPVSQVWIAVLVGLFWVWLFPAAAPPASAQPLPLRRGGWVWAMRLLGLAAVLLQLWLGLQMLPEAAHIGEHIDAATRAFPTERQQPRFWSHGLF